MARFRLPRLPTPVVHADVFGPGVKELGNALVSFEPVVTETRDSRRVMFGNAAGCWDCTVERIHQLPTASYANPHLTVWGSFIGGVYRATLKDGKWKFWEYRGVMDRGYFKGFAQTARLRLPLGADPAA